MKKQHATSCPSQLVSSRVKSEVAVFQVKSNLRLESDSSRVSMTRVQLSVLYYPSLNILVAFGYSC